MTPADRLAAAVELVEAHLETAPESFAFAIETSLAIIGTRPGGPNALPKSTWRHLLTGAVLRMGQLGEYRGELGLVAVTVRELLLAAAALSERTYAMAQDALDRAEELMAPQPA